MTSFLSIQQITRLFFVVTLALTVSFVVACDDDSAPTDNNTNQETDPTEEEEEQVTEYFRASIGGLPWNPPEMSFGVSQLDAREFLLSGFDGFARSLNFFLEGEALGEYVVDPGRENFTSYNHLAQGISVAAMSGSIILVEAPAGYVKGTFDVTMTGNLHITGEFLVEKDE